MLLTEYDEKKTMRLFRKEAWEEGMKEGIQIGRQEGLKKGQDQIIRLMAQNGASAEEISRLTGLSITEITRACQEPF